MSSVSAFDRDAAVAGMLPDHERPYVHNFSLGARLWDALFELGDMPAVWDAIGTLSVDDLRAVALYAITGDPPRSR